MDESTVETKRETVRSSLPNKNIFKISIVISLAFGIGYIHYDYVSSLFENVHNFSHLSEMEREILFRTEMGFYYSYYKTIVEEKSFLTALATLLNDKLVEFPKQIDAIRRFNIHPEVLIGSMYRVLQPHINTSTYRQCHIVHRGEGLSTVESCVGIGEPVFFYLEIIWMLAGLKLAALFLHATTLSESVLGGVLSVGHYFANHSDATRAQWAPNERENFAAPLLLLQAWLVTTQLRDRHRRFICPLFPLQMAIIIANALCLVCWQFTQFIFVTQTAIFFIMEQLCIIDIKTFRIFLHSHFWGLHIAILLLNGNDMLVASVFTAFFMVVVSYGMFQSRLRVQVKHRGDLALESLLVVLRLLGTIVATFFLKRVLANRASFKEDAHVWDLLYSKFTNYKTFHTLLYTCSDVFDYLPWSTVKRMCQSLLIPSALLSVLFVAKYWITDTFRRLEEKSQRDRDATMSDKDGENADDEPRSDSHENATDLDVLLSDTGEKGEREGDTTHGLGIGVKERDGDRSRETNKCGGKSDSDKSLKKNKVGVCKCDDVKSRKPHKVAKDKVPREADTSKIAVCEEDSNNTRVAVCKIERDMTEACECDKDNDKSREANKSLKAVCEGDRDKTKACKCDKDNDMSRETDKCRVAEGERDSDMTEACEYDKYSDKSLEAVCERDMVKPCECDKDSDKSRMSVCDRDRARVSEKDELLEFLLHLRVDAAIFYNVTQMVAFGCMAALVMRLKLLFVTQMCVVCSLIMNMKYYVLPKWCMKGVPVFWFLVMATLTGEVVQNITQERKHLGEFLDVSQEQLLEWIKAETGVQEAFAGSMPTLATVMLTTRRPIVAHPHYEHQEARERAYAVYKVYGRFSSSEMFNELTKLRASYLIVETKYCFGCSGRGCTFEAIWDVEVPNRKGPRLCERLLREAVDHFYPMFRNDHYAVFRVHDFGVRYMPRSFDT